jgi:HlyD family secretion protein
LDAFGDAQPFTGFVTAEYPDQTKVQDAVYYKAIVGIDTQGKDVKPGMTADVTILTAERASSTLSIPTRAVRQVDGQPTVQVLVNGKAEDRAITTGLRADEARVEVLSGLKVGEQVIVGELTAQEYAARQKTTQP